MLFQKKKLSKDYIYTVLAILIPVVWIWILRAVTVTDGESSLDGFYHARIALEGPSVFMSKEFNPLAFSIWHDTFADKELLYHFLLWIILWIQKLFGVSPEVPFNFPAIVFSGLAIGSFVFAAKRLGAENRIILAASLIFALAAPNFTYRFLMLRPHVLSIAFLLVVCAVASRVDTSFKVRLIILSAMSFVYSWTYSNPHFIFLVILLFSIFNLGKDRKKELLIPLCSIICVMGGLLLHPQYPNSFSIWSVQSFDALFSPLSEKTLIPKPGEMQSPPFAWQKNALTVYLIYGICVFMFVRLIERRSFKGVNRAYYPIFIIATAMVFSIFIAMRSIEYAVPFTVLMFAMLASDFIKDPIPFFKLGIEKRTVLALTGIGTLALALFSTFKFYSLTHERQYLPPLSMAQWMRDNIPSGTRIANINWSDFTRLYYVAPEYQYLWGMDPVFAYAKDKNTTLMLSELLLPGSTKRSRRVTARELAAQTQSDYAILLINDVTKENAISKIQRMGQDYQRCLVFKGEGIIFRLR